MFSSQLWRVSILGGSRALAALLGFFSVWQIAQILGPAQLGIWSIALATHGYLLHFSEWGQRSLITAEAGANPASMRSWIKSYVILRLILTAMFSVAALAVTIWLYPDHLMLVAFLCLSLFAIAIQMDWVAMVKEQFVFTGSLFLIRPLCFVILLFFVPDVSTPSGVAACFAGAWWIAALISQLTLLKLKDYGQNRVPKSYKMLKMGMPLMMVTLVNQIQFNADLILVGLLLGTEVTGHYYVAVALVTGGLVFSNAMGQSAMASMGRFRDDHAAFKKELISHLKFNIGLSLALAFCIAIVMPFLIDVAFGPLYSASTGLVYWLLPWFILQGMTILVQGAMTAMGQKLALKRSNIALLLGLIPALAIAGAFGIIHLFALARAFAELCRLVVLIKSTAGLSVQHPSWTQFQHRPKEVLKG